MEPPTNGAILLEKEVDQPNISNLEWIPFIQIGVSRYIQKWERPARLMIERSQTTKIVPVFLLGIGDPIIV